MSIGYLICIILSVLFFIASYLIWKKKMLFLIAGYHQKEFEGDKERLAKIMGKFCLFVGFALFLLPIALELIGSAAGMIFGVIVFAAGIRIAVIVQDY